MLKDKYEKNLQYKANNMTVDQLVKHIKALKTHGAEHKIYMRALINKIPDYKKVLELIS